MISRAAESGTGGAGIPVGELRLFIADLRTRLKRGDFRGQRNLWLDNELTLTDVERAVRDLLGEVDEYAALPPQQREEYPWNGRREKLADTLRRLQRVLGAPRQPELRE